MCLFSTHLFSVCVNRDYQQDQRASSFVSARCVSRWGPTGCDTGHETGVEWRAREEADLWGHLQTGKRTEKTLLTQIYTSYIHYIHTLHVCYTQQAQLNGDTVPVPMYSFSSRASLRVKRPTSLTQCCECWNSTHPIWRIWSERGQRSWRWRDRRPTTWWLRCCPSECPARHDNTVVSCCRIMFHMFHTDFEIDEQQQLQVSCTAVALQ